MRVRRLALLSVLVAVAACGTGPTEPMAAPADASMDGNGFTLGGGRTDTVPTPGSGNQTAGTTGNGFTLGGG